MNSWLAVVGCAVAAAAALLPLRPALFVGAATVGAVTWAAAAWRGGLDAARPLAAACLFLVVLLVRRLLRDRRRAVELLAAERAAHSATAEVAAAAERDRLARDLHDGLTHLLVSQLLLLRTARAALSDGDEMQAGGRIDTAVRLCGQAIHEARDVVRVLRGQAPDLTLLRNTAVDWGTATGHTVEVVLPPGPLDLDGAAWGALLATLREALTNVARHGSHAAVRVVLTQSDDELRLSVDQTSGGTAPPLPPGDGSGLQGLAERAALVGGTITAGPSPRGWEVCLALPAGRRP